MGAMDWRDWRPLGPRLVADGVEEVRSSLPGCLLSPLHPLLVDPAQTTIIFPDWLPIPPRAREEEETAMRTHKSRGGPRSRRRGPRTARALSLASPTPARITHA